MLSLRTELQMYAGVCEALLSSVLDPELTQEEKNFILYYAKELFQKFSHHNGHRLPPA